MPLILLVALAPTWLDSLEAAQADARAHNRPVLIVLLEPGERASESLERALERAPLAKRLAGFACVKLDRSKHPALVAKYGLRHSPGTIILSSLGSPLKLIVGPTSSAKYAAQLDDALKRHAELWNPKRPETPPARGAPRTTREIPRLVHGARCPDACPHCAPALRNARAWLARRQQADGRWTKPAEERELGTAQRRIDRSIDRIDVALTAVGGLAFLGEKPAERAARWLASRVGDDGVVRASERPDPLFDAYTQFETPLAAFLLAAQEDPPREALARIAAYLQRVQDPKSGAWGYGPDFREHPSVEKRGWRLLATTHGALSALNVLPGVDDEAKRKAAAYLLACRGRDGLFAYRPADTRVRRYPGATAGALFALMRSGVVAGDALEPSWTALRRTFPDLDGFGEHRWFFLLFEGLAFHARGPGAARAFHRHFRDVLVHEQRDDGSFEDPDGKGGSVFATAVAAMVLADRFPVAPRAPDPAPEVAAKRYLELPGGPKVFEHGGRYWIDLVVSFDRPVDDAFRRAFESALLGANRTLYDVTDGQMSVHAVTLHLRRGSWETADIRVSPEFRDQRTNPHPWAHGMTRLKTTTDLASGKQAPRLGQWILFPADGLDWADARMHHVLAHELCHYLFGAKDEYHQRTGESFCDCILGRRGATELCDATSHTDDRQEVSCGELARRLYPRLKPPGTPDPGPWDPPGPGLEWKD